MVSDLFRDVPPMEDEVLEDDAEKDESTDSDDEASATSTTNTTKPGNEEEEADGPVSRAKYEADMAGMTKMITELRTNVGRAQSLARRVSDSSEGAEALAQLRESNLATAELFETLVDGIDASAIDPALRQRIKQARAEILQAEQKAALLDEVRKELGISPTAARDQETLDAAQEQANALAEEIEDQIIVAGFDPDDAAFPWKDWVALFKTEGPRAVRRAALKAIQDKRDEDDTGTRRETRRAAAAKTPRGNAPSGKEDPLLTGDLDSKIKALP